MINLLADSREQAANQPNPNVVRAIWERVLQWAEERGRLSAVSDQLSANSSELIAVISEWKVIGPCTQCDPKSHCEIRLHPDGRKCGGTVCHQLFNYPSMTVFPSQYGQGV